jgi:hypothetical protein
MPPKILDPVPLGRIFLSLDNPRHVPLATEDEVIEYLCDKEDVWPLARDIANHGLNPMERFALVPVAGQKGAYTMAEGNRRLCALKLLADPDRAPARLRKGFEGLAKRWTPIKTVSAVAFDNNDDVRLWLERIHNGPQGGIGRKPWNADQQQRFSGSSKNRIALKFLDYAVGEGMLTEEQRKGKLTTVQRFLGIDVFREAMGLDQSNPEELARTRPKPEFDAIAKRFVRDLLEGKDVNSRMNKREVIEYSRPLSSLPGVTATRIEAEPLAEGAVDDGKRKRSRKGKPKKPEKARHVEHADEIASSLRSYGNHKLISLYHSICMVELESHTPLVCIGVWSFMETLTACAGRAPTTAFGDFLSNQRLTNYGITGSKTPFRNALTRTQDYGNTTKHDPVAVTFNGDQLNNDVITLKPVILKLIEEAASKAP